MALRATHELSGLGATEAALKYRELWRVERCFRESKSLLRTRPAFHWTDKAIRGHVFRSFLALVLKQDLQRRLREAGAAAERADLIRGLERLQEMVIEAQGKRFALRTQASEAVKRALSCVGACLPPPLCRDEGGDLTV